MGAVYELLELQSVKLCVSGRQPGLCSTPCEAGGQHTSHLRLLSSSLCPSHRGALPLLGSPSEDNVLGCCDCPNPANPGSPPHQCWGLPGHCISLFQSLSAPRAPFSASFPIRACRGELPSPCPLWVSLYPARCPCSGPARPTSGKDQAGAAQPVLGAVILQPRAGSVCRLWGQVPLQLLVGSKGTPLPAEPSGTLCHAVVSPSAPVPSPLAVPTTGNPPPGSSH